MSKILSVGIILNTVLVSKVNSKYISTEEIFSLIDNLEIICNLKFLRMTVKINA